MSKRYRRLFLRNWLPRPLWLGLGDRLGLLKIIQAKFRLTSVFEIFEKKLIVKFKITKGNFPHFLEVKDKKIINLTKERFLWEEKKLKKKFLGKFWNKTNLEQQYEKKKSWDIEMKLFMIKDYVINNLFENIIKTTKSFEKYNYTYIYRNLSKWVSDTLQRGIKFKKTKNSRI